MVHRIFHFDIKTLANYGDTILFELVRETFNTFRSRRDFYVAGSVNLRDTVQPELIDRINDEYDAVLIGGGGLFLADTNPNDRSGWQWDCSMELLSRLKKPLIVFAVGNNRFPGQPDFGERFREHVNLVVEKSIFFGLRNTGSVRTIREYLRPELRSKVVLQPCPTTLLAKLCPDIVKPDLERARRLGIQANVTRRHLEAGFDGERIYDELIAALSTLRSEGWRMETIAHGRSDRGFHKVAAAKGLEMPLTRFFNTRHIFNPIKHFAALPLVIGMRGHAQMIPFGLGAPIISLLNHDKLKYFLDDIGMPELAVDIRKPGFGDDLVERCRHVYDSFADIRRTFAERQEDMFALTMRNLAEISGALGGKRTGGDIVPYSPFERKLAQSLFLATHDMERERAEREQAARDAECAAAAAT